MNKKNKNDNLAKNFKTQFIQNANFGNILNLNINNFFTLPHFGETRSP